MAAAVLVSEKDTAMCDFSLTLVNCSFSFNKLQRSKCPRHIDTIKNQRVVLCLFVLIFQGDREPLKKLLGDRCVIFLKKFENHWYNRLSFFSSFQSHRVHT